MNKKLMILPLIAVLMIGLMVVPVQAAGNVTPLKAKSTLTGASLTLFDSDYNSKDYAIVSGNQLNLDKIITGLVIPKEDAFVDLSETTLVSDPAIDSASDFYPSFINNTFNSAVESTPADVLVSAQLSGAYADTRMDANVVFNTSGVETATWYSYLASDENGDGDYEDAADRHYRTSIGKSGQILYWNVMADWNDTDADNYVKTTWSFKTTGASDYDFEIIQRDGNGDAAWSNIDSSGENTITLTLYDTDGVAIALMAGMDELLQMDLGDNPVISGLNEIIIEVGTDNAAMEVDVRVNNFAVFNDFPAITDNSDNDDDWDLDGEVGGLMIGVHDDNDFLITAITEDTTDTYSSQVPLYTDIEVSPYTMPQDAKRITFSGNLYFYPQEWSSVSVAQGGYYETTESWSFDTTTLDDLQTTANVLTFTDVYYNMTLTEDLLVDEWDSFEDSLLSFEFEGTDKVEELRSYWDAADEDGYKVGYDGDGSHTDSGGVAIAAEADSTGVIILVGAVVVAVLAVAYFAISSRKPKRRRKK